MNPERGSRRLQEKEWGKPEPSNQPRGLSDREKERRADVLKRIRGAFDEILRPAGFVREGSTWRRVGNGVVGVVNLQRSSFGLDYMVNVGVFVKSFGYVPNAADRGDRPDEVDCHIRARYESLPSETDHGAVGRLLDLEMLPEAEISRRIAAAKQVVADVMLPFLEQFTSEPEVRRWARQRSWSAGLDVDRRLTGK